MEGPCSRPWAGSNCGCFFRRIPVICFLDKQAVALPAGVFCLLGKEESLDSIGGAKANGLPPRGEDKWNRKNVQLAKARLE